MYNERVNPVEYPGVAQLVGRLVWDQDAASSSLATRTKRPESPLGGSGLLLCMKLDSNIFMQLSGGQLLVAGWTATTP